MSNICLPSLVFGGCTLPAQFFVTACQYCCSLLLASEPLRHVTHSSGQVGHFMDVGIDQVFGIYISPRALMWFFVNCHRTVPVLLSLPIDPWITVMVYLGTIS